MSTFGYGQGGQGGFGPSKLYQSLPWKGWREVGTWIEELADSIGYRLDVLNNRFISASARANMLDPTYTPSDVPSTYLSTATAPAILATSADTMIDVLAYVALGLYPLDSNLSVAQKQALVGVGWTALKRKATRLQMLSLASKITDGIAVGWSAPPNNFSIILPDGAPSPGFGGWTQSNNTTSEVIRPWILSAVRQVVSKGTPAWVQLGVGFSQFRAGYSSAGETVFPSGCRINALAHEHFDTWAASVPTGWTKTGSATLTQSTSDTSINWEFTGSAAVLDLTGAASGLSVGLSQSTQVNNQFTHRLQIDYKYTNAQSVNQLCTQVTDVNRDGNTYYWTGSAWTTTATTLTMPVSSTRTRYAIDVIPQSSSSSATTQGTDTIAVKVFATSDGTATTQTTYTLYRVGLYEKFNLAIESAALGERTAWLPLFDSAGWTLPVRAADSVTLLESANAGRTAYKAVTSTGVGFPYRAALSGRGFHSNSTWVNLLKGSNDFGADWTLTNATRTANTTISPLVGETVASAPTLAATSTAARIVQGSLGTPTSKSYVGGVWVKKLSTDGNFTDVTISGVSTSTQSQAYTVTQAQGWTLLPFNFTFGAGDVAALSLKLAWGAASSNGQIAVATAYLYDVTGKAGVLYPPVTQTAIGATGTLNPTRITVVTAATNTNVLHPLTQRTLASVVRGAVGMTIVPTFDASSQPSGTIFDVEQAATQNRVVLRVNSGALELKRWDNAGNTWTASLTMTANPSPAAGSMTWLRDTAITIRCIFDENSTMLSAGNGFASGTKPGSWAPVDASVATFRIGQDPNTGNQFDGIIRGVEVAQLGAAAS